MVSVITYTVYPLVDVTVVIIVVTAVRACVTGAMRASPTRTAATTTAITRSEPAPAPVLSSTSPPCWPKS